MKKSKLKEALRPFVREALSDYLKDTEQDQRALQAAHPQLDLTDTPVEYGMKKEGDEKVEEASTSSGAGPFSTPYAFSDTSIDKDAKKRDIAQQLGYKIVKKKSLTEESRVNVAKAVPLKESFTPQLQTTVAHVIYGKMLDYLIMADDPKFAVIKKFRKMIDKVPSPQDKKQLILAFNDGFRVSDHQGAWEYYK